MSPGDPNVGPGTPADPYPQYLEPDEVALQAGAELVANKAAASGYAGLDSSSHLSVTAMEIRTPDVIHVHASGDDTRAGFEYGPKATIQAAVDVAGTGNWMRPVRIAAHGQYNLTTTVDINRKHVIIEGDGWSPVNTNGTVRGTLFKWGGSAGIPMFKFRGGSYGGGIRNAHIYGNLTAKPSAAIDVFRDNVNDPGPNALFSFQNLHIGRMQGFDDDGVQTVAGYMDPSLVCGILSDGGNQKNDMSIWDNITIDSVDYGVRLLGTQNVGHDFRSLRVIFANTIAFETHARCTGRNWYFLANKQDIMCTENASLQITDFSSETSGIFYTVPADQNGTLSILGGIWQLNGYHSPVGLGATGDGVIVDMKGMTGAGDREQGLSLYDFEFPVDSGTYSGSPTPIIRADTGAAGAVEAYIHAYRVKGLDPDWISATATGGASDIRDIDLMVIPGNAHAGQDWARVRNYFTGADALNYDPTRFDMVPAFGSRPVLATGAAHDVDDVITVLQNYGLVKQS